MNEVVARACPPPLERVAAWLCGEHPTLSDRPLSISEPVVYRRGRAYPSPVDPRRRDAVVHSARVRTTDPRQVIGAKPAAFCWWVFDLLGALPGDEARPPCRPVGDRQALWGMTDEEMAARLGTAEARWIGEATARRILLSLPGPRRPCAHESEWTGRARARDERARGRARAAGRRAS
jgi:hypothetical protein